MPGTSKETRNMKNHISGIYLIRDLINNKVYVGQSKSCTTRWRNHLYGLKNKRHLNGYLQSVFNDHGVDCFQYEILEICEEELRGERERYWIEHYKSNDLNYGYNLQYGGRLNRNHSEETKEKQRQAKLGIVFSDEHKRKIGLASRGNTAMLGKHHSEETKLKMSLACLGKKRSEETKQKMREANLGKKLSDEHRRKLSESHKGQKAWNKGNAKTKNK